MRPTMLVCIALIGQVGCLSGQVTTPEDSIRLADALAAYVLAHPVGVDVSHGPMSGIAIDSGARGWGVLLTAAVRRLHPDMSLDPASPSARNEPHLRLRAVVATGDSVFVMAVWSRCYPGAGGESGWPMDYTMRHSATGWLVERAGGSLVGHGPRCSFDRGPAR